MAHDPMVAIEAELQSERAYALGLAGKRVETALAELAAAPPALVEMLLDDAGTAVWHYLIVRESLGMYDHAAALRGCPAFPGACSPGSGSSAGSHDALIRGALRTPRAPRVDVREHREVNLHVVQPVAIECRCVSASVNSPTRGTACPRARCRGSRAPSGCRRRLRELLLVALGGSPHSPSCGRGDRPPRRASRSSTRPTSSPRRASAPGPATASSRRRTVSPRYIVIADDSQIATPSWTSTGPCRSG